MNEEREYCYYCETYDCPQPKAKRAGDEEPPPDVSALSDRKEDNDE